MMHQPSTALEMTFQYFYHMNALESQPHQFAGKAMVNWNYNLNKIGRPQVINALYKVLKKIF